MAGSSSAAADRVCRPDNGRFDARANALRALAFDAVQQANSGHPGAPMSMAEMAVALCEAAMCSPTGRVHAPCCGPPAARSR